MADWDAQRTLQIAKRLADNVNEDDQPVDIIIASLSLAAAASSYVQVPAKALHTALDHLLAGIRHS
jgi:hypothetical protein